MKRKNDLLWITLFVTATLCSGCSLPFGVSPQRSVFSVDLSKSECVRERNRTAGTLLIKDFLGESLTSTQRILYRDSSRSVSSYQLSQWVEPPTTFLSNELLRRLQRAEPFTVVSKNSGSVVGDYQINVQLHDYSFHRDQEPRAARIAFTAELVRLMDRAVLSQRSFEISKESAADNPESVVQALEEGSLEGVSQICRWLEEIRP